MTKKYKIKLKDAKPFGMMFDLRKHIPKECSVIIVCINDGSGLQPKLLLLPHQLYKKYVEKLLNEMGVSSYKQVTIIPARHTEFIDLLQEK